MSSDPLLQPFKLKHLTLRNRIITTSHEPAYPEDGMPKERYRAYHVERAKGGVALTMTAGSASVSRDSPPVFNNLLAYKDEVVPWLRSLADACHEHGAAVMIHYEVPPEVLEDRQELVAWARRAVEAAVAIQAAKAAKRTPRKRSKRKAPKRKTPKRTALSGTAPKPKTPKRRPSTRKQPKR
jgi:2,4-dienoyl-CoA reductase-like NADH-dependent reductase (Old Yellow Enzyme family)